MIDIIINNIQIKLEFKDISEKQIKWIMQQIHESLDPLDPNRYRNRAYNLRDKFGHRLWDGRVKLIDMKNHLVPTGLYNDLMAVMQDLSNQGYEYNIKDNRGSEFSVKVPSQIVLNGNGLEKDLKLRDYQQTGVELIMKEQLGIILASTNSGKTSLALSTYKYLLPKLQDNEKLLFIAPNSSIMNQVYIKFQHYLGANYIGVWGDGQKDLSRPIICATIQTLASAIKKPKTKLTKKHDRLIERLATKYGPAVLEKGSPKANLRLLAMNFKPKYKYEADDVDVLRDLSVNLDTDKAVTEVFKGYQKQYKKLLYKRNEQGFKKYDEAVDFLKQVKAVFVDEAHYAGADSYWKVFQYLTNARMRIGMTGTLDKSQKVKMQKIKALLGTPIERISNDQMIKRGVSAKPHIKMVPVDQPQDLDIQIGAEAKRIGANGNSVNGDLLNYQIAYRLGVIENEYRNKLIAQLAYKASQQLHKQAVLIIINSIEHGELINKELDKLHANYAFLQGKDDTEIRQKAFQDVRDGKLSILVGTKILDAGIDIPNLKVLIVCSAGKSYISLLQRIGRILRIMPDKRDVYIFDLFDRTTSYLYSHAKKRVKYYKEEGFDVS